MITGWIVSVADVTGADVTSGLTEVTLGVGVAVWAHFVQIVDVKVT